MTSAEFDPIHHARYQQMLEDPGLNPKILELLDTSTGSVALELAKVLPEPTYENTSQKIAGHFALIAAGLYERTIPRLEPMPFKTAGFRKTSDPYTTLTRHFYGRIKPGATLISVPIEPTDLAAFRQPENIKGASKIVLAAWLRKGAELVPGITTCITTVRQSENGAVMVNQDSRRDERTTNGLKRADELSREQVLAIQRLRAQHEFFVPD